MLEKLSRFMMGRYGSDKLNIYLLIIGFIFSILGQIFFSFIFIIISYAFWVYSIYRMMSRNINARQKEYYAFLKYITPLEKWFKIKKTMFSQRKMYKYFKCPSCKQNLRAPKGRGEIRVTCQKCNKEFNKKV